MGLTFQYEASRQKHLRGITPSRSIQVAVGERATFPEKAGEDYQRRSLGEPSRYPYSLRPPLPPYFLLHPSQLVPRVMIQPVDQRASKETTDAYENGAY